MDKKGSFVHEKVRKYWFDNMQSQAISYIHTSRARLGDAVVNKWKFFRFFRVEKLAKRTALIDEDGGSLLRYALSYLQVQIQALILMQNIPVKD